MAAPTPTARITPTGWKMPDGFKSLITFKNAPAVQFWEKTVKPPGFDGGDKIDTTTMHNIKYRTGAAKFLITLTESSAACAYDPDVIDNILNLVNQETTITITFPDHTTLAFYGFLNKFEMNDLKEGEMPEASVSIMPTNWDSVNFVEAAPVLTEAPGT